MTLSIISTRETDIFLLNTISVKTGFDKDDNLHQKEDKKAFFTFVSFKYDLTILQEGQHRLLWLQNLKL